MVDNNKIYINYSAAGLYTDDTSRVLDDIFLDVVEEVPGKKNATIAQVHIVRVPSDLRGINIQQVDNGYSMANAMSIEYSSRADTVAFEMELDNPNIHKEFTRILKENDLYIIKKVYVTKKKRNAGYGSYILGKLPSVLKRITNDRRPVIAVVPCAFENPADIVRAEHFFEINNYKKVHSCAQTWYHY